MKYHCNHVEMLYERLKPIYDANDRRYSRMQMYERISLILNYPSDQQSQDCFSHIDKPCTNTPQLCYRLCHYWSCRYTQYRRNNFVARCIRLVIRHT